MAMNGAVETVCPFGALRRVVASVGAAVVAVLVFGVPVSAADPPAVAGTMTPVFADDFDANSLDRAKWTPGWFSDAAVSGPMTGKCVATSNVTQDGTVTPDGAKVLRLKLTPSASACGATIATDTGGLVESSPGDGVAGHAGFSFTYGYVEWRAKLPSRSAACTAICIAATPQLWSMPGTPVFHNFEIDALEGYGGDACWNTHGSDVDPGTVPFDVPPPGCVSATPTWVNDFHTYGALWTPSGVSFFYDGAYRGSGRPGVHSTPDRQFLVMDLINTGSPVTTTKELLVDYVKVWQKDSDGDHVPDAPADNPDRCPDSAGPATLQGCPDGDGDGIPDIDDKCPTASGPSALKGCPSKPTRPALLIQADGSQDVFFRGADHHIWQLQWDATGSGAGSWHATPLDMTVTAAGDPAAYVQADGTITVYFRDPDDAIWQLQWDATGSGAHTWHSTKLGGLAASDPIAYVQPDGSQDVLFRGTDGAVWQWQWDATGSGAHTWHLTSLGGSAAGRLAAYVASDGAQTIYFRGTDSRIWQLLWYPTGGGSHIWHLTPLGGSAAGDPAAYLAADGSQNVYYRGTDGQIDQLLWYPSGAGSGVWHVTALGGSPLADPAALRRSDGTQSVYFENAGHGITQLQWDATGSGAGLWHTTALLSSGAP